MAYDAVIYRAKPARDEMPRDPRSATVLVVNFDSLRLKKIKHVAAFATDGVIETDSWTTVLEYLGPAIRLTAGDDCSLDLITVGKSFDIRLEVPKHDIKDVVKRLTRAMAKYKLVLKKVNI